MLRLVALLIGSWLAGAAPGSAGPAIGDIVNHDLPPGLSWPTDVRWSTADDEVFVSALDRGIVRFALGAPAKAHAVLHQGNGIDEFWLPVHLATSSDFTVVGAPIHLLAYLRNSNGRLEGRRPMEFIVDLDAYEDRLLLLGLRRDDQRAISPDGAIAWMASLSAGGKAIEPILFSSDGVGAKSMDHCGPMQMGTVRFLPDGRYVIAAGVEDAITLYHADGRPQRIWQAQALGVDTACDLSEDEVYRLSANAPARYRWLDQRQILDDALPLADGAALLVRFRDGDVTRWRMVVLRDDGAVEQLDLPLTASGGVVNLRGDVRGDRVVLLQTVRRLATPMGPQKKPSTEPILLTARLGI